MTYTKRELENAQWAMKSQLGELVLVRDFAYKQDMLGLYTTSQAKLDTLGVALTLVEEKLKAMEPLAP